MSLIAQAQHKALHAMCVYKNVYALKAFSELERERERLCERVREKRNVSIECRSGDDLQKATLFTLPAVGKKVEAIMEL